MGNGSKVPADSIPKAHTWLPDGALAAWSAELRLRTSRWVYTAGVQDAKMEILINRDQ